MRQHSHESRAVTDVHLYLQELDSLARGARKASLCFYDQAWNFAEALVAKTLVAVFTEFVSRFVMKWPVTTAWVHLLEWYRGWFDHHDLMDEMDLLLQKIAVRRGAERADLQPAFIDVLGVSAWRFYGCSKTSGSQAWVKWYCHVLKGPWYLAATAI